MRRQCSLSCKLRFRRSHDKGHAFHGNLGSLSEYLLSINRPARLTKQDEKLPSCYAGRFTPLGTSHSNGVSFALLFSARNIEKFFSLCIGQVLCSIRRC